MKGLLNGHLMSHSNKTAQKRASATNLAVQHKNYNSLNTMIKNREFAVKICANVGSNLQKQREYQR